jgi:hypothetical protein
MRRLQGEKQIRLKKPRSPAFAGWENFHTQVEKQTKKQTRHKKPRNPGFAGGGSYTQPRTPDFAESHT